MGKPTEDILNEESLVPKVDEGDVTSDAPKTEATFEQEVAAEGGITTLGELSN